MSKNTLIIPLRTRNSNSNNNINNNNTDIVQTVQPPPSPPNVSRLVVAAPQQQQPQPLQRQSNLGKDVGWSISTAVKIFLVMTLATVLLSDVVGIYYRLIDVAAQHEKAEAKLQMRSCVFQRNPDLRVFTNKTEVRLIQLAGFAECDEASAFIKTVFWRYVSAVTSTYAICNSINDCRDYLLTRAMYVGGVALVTWSSWAWLLPYAIPTVLGLFNSRPHAGYIHHQMYQQQQPRPRQQQQQQQPVITHPDDEWEDEQ
jgi:hypothetical protein